MDRAVTMQVEVGRDDHRMIIHTKKSLRQDIRAGQRCFLVTEADLALLQELSNEMGFSIKMETSAGNRNQHGRSNLTIGVTIRFD